MAMHYLPLAINEQNFNHKCPYCNNDKLSLTKIVHKTQEHECQNCFKVFITAPFGHKSDIEYPVYLPDDSGLEEFQAPILS